MFLLWQYQNTLLTYCSSSSTVGWACNRNHKNRLVYVQRICDCPSRAVLVTDIKIRFSNATSDLFYRRYGHHSTKVSVCQASRLRFQNTKSLVDWDGKRMVCSNRENDHHYAGDYKYYSTKALARRQLKNGVSAAHVLHTLEARLDSIDAYQSEQERPGEPTGFVHDSHSK